MNREEREGTVEPEQRSAANEREKERKKLTLSICFYVFGYIVLLAMILIMVIINDPEGWTSYLVHSYANVVFLIVSIFFLLSIVFCYFFFEDRSVLIRPKETVLIFSLIIFSLAICYLFGRYVNTYIRPFALFALLCLFLLNRRQAIFLNFIFTFLLFIIDMYTNAYDTQELIEEVFATLMLGFVSGTFAVFFADKIKTRIGLLFTGVFLCLPTSLFVALFTLSTALTDWGLYLADIGWRLLGSLLSAILALALLPVFETIFARLTIFRLRELTSPNVALLSELKEKAPGTFTHSLTVAQLAEACALAIGENAELARACAYYHDVGKIKNPSYFTENQMGGENPHDEILPELSADIIRAHTRDGHDLLLRAHLPPVIADVAQEHHGTLTIKYFYDKARRFKGEDVSLKSFSYLGPKPKSKIAAIIMIADAAEAATRSLSDHSALTIANMLRNIIEERLDLGQFDDCNITLKELTVIKNTLLNSLGSVHHQRVQYPAISFARARKRDEDKGDEDE